MTKFDEIGQLFQKLHIIITQCQVYGHGIKMCSLLKPAEVTVNGQAMPPVMLFIRVSATYTFGFDKKIDSRNDISKQAGAYSGILK